MSVGRVSIATTSHFFFQLRCSWATAWHHRPGSFHPLQESQSCGSRAAGGEEEEGMLPYGPLRPVTPASLGPKTRVCALSGACLALGRLRAGPPGNTEVGGLFREALGFRFCFFFKSRDTTLIKNMSFIPCEVLCQATLKNLLPSISSKSIFFNKVPKYTFTQIIVVPKNPLQLFVLYIGIYIGIYIYNVRFLQIG